MERGRILFGRPKGILRVGLFLLALIVATLFNNLNLVKAAAGSTNTSQLNTVLSISPPITNFTAPVTASFLVANSGASMSSGTMTVTLYCDTPVYFDGGAIFQYPGLRIDLRAGYILKKQNIPVTTPVSLPSACSYTGKGLSYTPIVVVEHAGYAAWSSTTLKTNAAITPSPTVSATKTPLSEYGVKIYRTTSNSAVVPFSETLAASITVPSPTLPGVWIDYISGNAFTYDLCCDKNANGSCNVNIPSAWLKGSPYTFTEQCTYSKAGTYTREVRATNHTNLDSIAGYRFATNQITVTDPVTNLSANLVANPSRPNDSQNTTLTALATTNNVSNTINYSFWWQCLSTATNFTNAKAECGDPTNSAIGAKFDGQTAATISKSVIHKYGAGIYHPKVIIEQGNASATKAFNLTIDNAPVLVPALQIVDNNALINDVKRSYNLTVSNSGTRIATTQNYSLWWNCNKGLDSFQDTLSLCGSIDPTDYSRTVNTTAVSKTVTHGYFPGTYKAKVVVQRDGLEKAAYKDLIVPAIVPSVIPSPSPSPSPSKTPSPFPSPSPSKTPSPIPSPSKTPSPSVIPSPSPSPSKTPSPSPSPSTTPGVMTISMTVSPGTPRYDGQTLTITAGVTDTNTQLASTNFTFWWDCNNPSTSVADTITACGQPRVLGDPNYTDQQRATGIQLPNVYGGTTLNKALATEKSATKVFSSGPRMFKLIVERRGVAIETRSVITILPNVLDVDLGVSPASGAVNELINLNAQSTSTDTTNTYSYYFWWDCDNTTTSVTEATSLCGSSTDATKGAQFLAQANTLTSKIIGTSYKTGGTKHPKVLVVHGNLSTSSVGEIEISVPTLIAGLTVNPTNVDGEASPATLTASAGGSAQGVVNYTFWWNCNSDTTSVAEASRSNVCGDPHNTEIGFKNDSMAVNSFSRQNNYTVAGTYHPKVIVERDGAPASEDRAQLIVNEIPQKTLELNLSAQRVGNSFPVNIALGANLSGTATGQTDYKIWWDCQPSQLDLASAIDECGDPTNSANGTTTSSPSGESSKTVSHLYLASGLRHPVVYAQRGEAVDIKSAEIDIPAQAGESLTPTPSEEPSTTATPIESQTPTPSPSPSPSATATPGTQFESGFSVVGFGSDRSSSIFTSNGFLVYELNQQLRRWNIYSPDDDETTMKANQAYYVYSAQTKTIDLGSDEDNSSLPTITPGWNFIWNKSNSNLNSMKVRLEKSGSCQADNVPLNAIKQAGVIYKWVYIVRNDRSLLACQAFSLLTGQDKSSTNCTLENPLLDEVSSAPADKGVWIYLFLDKLDSWQGKDSYPCE